MRLLSRANITMLMRVAFFLVLFFNRLRRGGLAAARMDQVACCCDIASGLAFRLQLCVTPKQSVRDPALCA